MFDFDKLDKLIHEKGRLGIMTLLATRPSWSFQDLKAELALSDGNLITHLRTLHDNGYVTVTKELKEVRERPQTTYALTDKGRQSFQEYLTILEQIVKAGRP
ncbi:MAG: transcriptional regulator [Chthoniobacter sp.]|uniref:transcriptional regulator n=1 Tax=Chthoniobacter sp. TaxID=2510640 RepID=UPI0032AB6F4A